ncbi:response regulator [Deinococcus pimensis]|uniref:response regulator n=1 Tax=Deinococcus pimensis TaxID=309888 RepID=UPI001FDF0E99|nr:response regulator [Deinococcus pimensis]
MLLAEDNADDRLLAELAFEDAGATTLYLVEDGEQALAFLRREPPYHDAPRPDVLLLDVNMPGLTGPDVARRIREEQALPDLPVLLLVSSLADIERWESRGVPADGYLVKPVDPDALTSALAGLRR